MKYLVLITLCVSLFACKDKEVEQHLSSISNMNNRLEDLDQTLKANSIDTISRISNKVRATILIVKQNYNVDTIDLAFASLINNYKEIRKVLPRNTRLKSKLSAAISEEKQTLSDLQHDISKGVNDREKYASFVTKEEAKMKQIDTLMADFVNTQNKYVTRFKDLHPKMVAFTQKLLADKQNNE